MERLAALGAGALVAAAGAACTFDGSGGAATSDGGTVGEDSGGIPPRIDAAPPDAPDLCTGWTLVATLDSCDLPVSFRSGTLTLASGGIAYDTDKGEFEPGIEHSSIVLGGIRVVSAETIEVETDAELRIQGDLPLLMVAWGDMNVAVDAEIDVSSRRLGGAIGAGADPQECLSGTVAAGNGGQDNSGGGGGGGGGYGTAGGEGGDGAEDTGGPAGDLANGAVRLRGGCKGGQGGVGLAGPVQGGRGGGAIALSARRDLRVNGLIHAGGAGGSGATAENLGGGGGGGSGGLIWLAGETITLGGDTRLAANGGGGGEGASEEEAGTPGGDALEDGQPARGGIDPQNVAGNGGDGAFEITGPGPGGPGQSSTGGGGGGGGAGIIFLDSDTVTTDGAIISPPPR